MAKFPGTTGVDRYSGTDDADEITGLEGNDILNGNGGDDIFYYKGSNFGVDTINGGSGEDQIRLYGDVSVNYADFGTTKLTSVESFSFYSYDFNGTTGADNFNFSGIITFSSNRYMNLYDGNDKFLGHGGANWVNGGSGNDYINGAAGNDELVGAEGNDTLIGGSGDDIFWIGGSSFGIDSFNGGDGSDVIRLSGDVSVNYADFGTAKVTGVETFSFYSYDFNGTAGADNFNFSGITTFSSNRYMYLYDGNDKFLGHGGANWINGGSGNDYINGAAGNDELVGAEGNDTLIGGSGDDVFWIGGSSFGNDTIDGGTGSDIIRLDRNTIVSRVDFSASKVKGVEFFSFYGYDFNGTIGADRFDFSGIQQFSSNRVMYLDNGNDVFIGHGGVNWVNGGAGNNSLNGGAGSDELNGAEGNDTLIGGTGADKMTGGAGNDTYYIDNTADQTIEVNGGGTDKVYSSVSYSIATQYIENIYLTGSAHINAVGNGLANVMAGNSGNNILNGGAGADHMSGGAGNDTYYVDNARDQTIEANGGGTDRVYSSVSYSIASQFIENIYLTGSANINATGNSLANIVSGNTGNNVLNGGAGNDVLYGGAGADDLVGGAGADTFAFKALSDTTVAASGRDTIFDFSGTGGDRIDLSAIDANTALAGNQAFSYLGTAAFTGKAGELRYVKSASDTYVYGDVNGDGKADFTIHLDDAVTFSKGYFVL